MTTMTTTMNTTTNKKHAATEMFGCELETGTLLTIHFCF